jgi:hypothetical protein
MLGSFQVDWYYWGVRGALGMLAARLLWLQHTELKSRAARLRKRLQAWLTIGVVIGLITVYFGGYISQLGTDCRNYAYQVAENQLRGLPWFTLLPWVIIGLTVGWKLAQFSGIGKLNRVRRPILTVHTRGM